MKKLEGCNFIAFILSNISATCSEFCLFIIMAQIYKVFINNFFILITDFKKIENGISSCQILSFDVELIDYLFSCQYTLNSNIVYQCKNPLAVFQNLQFEFEFITASGGVVKNKKNEVLMIYKNESWDLPKGKLNVQESIEDAALREVFEETNVKDLRIISKEFVTHHIYQFLNSDGEIRQVLKETTWFLMTTNLDVELIPQKEEGITQVNWISSSNIKNIKTYESIKCVLQHFMIC